MLGQILACSEIPAPLKSLPLTSAVMLDNSVISNVI